MLFTIYAHRLEELQKKYKRLAAKANAAGLETARKVIDYFKNGSFDDEFLHNIHVAAQQDFTRASGLLAYSYKAYQKEMERAAETAAKAAAAAHIEYYGSIGDKLQNIKAERSAEQ